MSAYVYGPLKKEETGANALLIAKIKAQIARTKARTAVLEAQRNATPNTGTRLPPAPSTIAKSSPGIGTDLLQGLSAVPGPVVGPLAQAAGTLGAIGQVDPSVSKATGEVSGVAGNVAGEVASTLFSDLEQAFGATLVKGLLYVLLAGGGAALIIAGIGRTTGTHPGGMVKKAAGAAAVGAAL